MARGRQLVDDDGYHPAVGQLYGVVVKDVTAGDHGELGPRPAAVVGAQMA